MTEENNTYSGFIALIGAPNAGKSTLLNQFIGQKISIVSRKVQTTRMQIRGVLTQDNKQLIFIDTPGIFRPKRRLDQSMVRSAWDGASGADHTVLLIDAQKGLKGEGVQDILQSVEKSGKKIDVILNKIDKIDKEILLEHATYLQNMEYVGDIFMISALRGTGIEFLKKHLFTKIPQGPFLYDPSDISDLPMKVLASEVTREHLYDQLHQEIPYNLTVETETIKKTKSGTKTPLTLEQTIYVTCQSHKSILLGKKGQKIKEIGKKSRLELAELLGRPVNLFLFVKIRENWQDDPERYSAMGLDF